MAMEKIIASIHEVIIALFIRYCNSMSYSAKVSDPPATLAMPPEGISQDPNLLQAQKMDK